MADPSAPVGVVVEAFLADLARQHRPASTVRAYRSDLSDFARFHAGSLAEVTASVLRSCLATLTGRAPATRARREAALASLLAWAYRAGLLDADPMSRIDRTRLPPSAPRPVPTGQVTAVLRVIPRHKDRDRAVVHPPVHDRHARR